MDGRKDGRKDSSVIISFRNFVGEGIMRVQTPIKSNLITLKTSMLTNTTDEVTKNEIQYSCPGKYF
jgi:hypothetical protein